MKARKILGLIVVAALAALLAMAMTACSGQEQAADEGAAPSEQAAGPELSDAQVDALMAQVAQSEVEKSYADYVTDEAFANAEIFGIDREGDNGTAYVWLNTAEYVVAKDKAYEMSGSSGEAIIKFRYTNTDPEFVEVIWSADGAGHETWIEENFPEEHMDAYRAYDPYDEDGNNVLNAALAQTVEGALGVPVEADNLLSIDVEAGTYEISSTSESGDPASDDYKFEVETIEQGQLADLK